MHNLIYHFTLIRSSNNKQTGMTLCLHNVFHSLTNCVQNILKPFFMSSIDPAYKIDNFSVFHKYMLYDVVFTSFFVNASSAQGHKKLQVLQVKGYQWERLHCKWISHELTPICAAICQYWSELSKMWLCQLLLTNFDRQTNHGSLSDSTPSLPIH